MPTNPYSYNVNPAPTSGSGPFGLVPGATSLPNPSADLSGQIPGLSGLNSQAAQTIASKLGGSISPATMNALQNAAATFGVGSGMPGSGLALNKLFGNIAGFTENQAQQGLQDYNSFVPTVSGTQTVSPALQTSVSQSNAQLGAAPSPGASQLYAQQLFNQYLQAMRGPGGGTRGPTVMPSGGSGTGTATAPSGAGPSGFPYNPTDTGTTLSPGTLDQFYTMYPELYGFNIPNSDIGGLMQQSIAQSGGGGTVDTSGATGYDANPLIARERLRRTFSADHIRQWIWISVAGGG